MSKSKGPKIEPCGTSAERGRMGEEVLPTNDL